MRDCLLTLLLIPIKIRLDAWIRFWAIAAAGDDAKNELHGIQDRILSVPVNYVLSPGNLGLLVFTTNTCFQQGANVFSLQAIEPP